MNSKTNHRDAMAVPAVRSDRGERAFVWGVWFVMLLIALVCIAKYGRNIPLAEDWLLVPAVTGNEPDLAGWLWAQNNEHRIPLPKVILLGLLKVAHGDFRAGMFLSTLTLGLLSLLMIRTARDLRGGRTRFADAFFPIALLHIGNWPNLVWGWQFTFVLPVALLGSVLLIIVDRRTLHAPAGAVITGFCAISLPLCGAVGLLFMPFFIFWGVFFGLLHRRTAQINGRNVWISVFLIGSAAAALCVSALYFIGYERPWWNPPSPGLSSTLKTTAKFIALSFGPAAARSWPVSVLVSAVFLLASAAAGLSGFFRYRGMKQYQALGILLFFGNIAIFSLAMGWGRAGLVPQVGLPARYVLLSVPAFLTAFFIWEIYGSPKLRSIVQSGLFLIMCLMLPFNMAAGFQWKNWYKQGMDAVEQDVLKETPRSVLAERHQKFLLHWDKEKLLAGMEMLHKAKIGIFAHMREESPGPRAGLTKE